MPCHKGMQRQQCASQGGAHRNSLVNTWQDASLETMPCSFVCVVISVLNALKESHTFGVRDADRATNGRRVRHIAAMPPKFPVHTLQTEALTTTVVREVKSM